MNANVGSLRPLGLRLRVGVGVGGSTGGPRGRGRAPHPRGKGVGPLVFIFGVDFLLFFLRPLVEFQVILRIFFSTHKTTPW